MNLNSFLKLAFLLILVIGYGCQKEEIEEEAEEVEEIRLCLAQIDGVFREVELEQYPEYLDGGDIGFATKVVKALTYPAEAREQGIEGTCILSYEISKDGELEQVGIVQDPGGGIGPSAADTLSAIIVGPAFSPGIWNGVPVRVKKEFKVLYELH